MGFKCGIVGLPNVGKSTLFNALTESAAAQAANYPFCTIEPNVGEVPVPDPRLDRLASIAKSAARSGLSTGSFWSVNQPSKSSRAISSLSRSSALPR